MPVRRDRGKKVNAGAVMEWWLMQEGECPEYPTGTPVENWEGDKK